MKLFPVVLKASFVASVAVSSTVPFVQAEEKELESITVNAKH